MAIFPFLGGPRRPRTERGERHLLAMRILTDAVSGPGTSVHAWSDDDRLCFKLAVDGGPSIEFRGFDSRGRAAFHVDLSEGGLAFVELDPRTWVDPGLFNRRAPILDRKGRPTITEAEFVSEVAARYVDLYRDVVARAEGMRVVLSASGKGVAALKATAFVASCEARGMDAVTWAQAAEAASMWSHQVEAREIRRLVGEEMVAALTGTPRMTDDRTTGKPGGPLQN